MAKNQCIATMKYGSNHIAKIIIRFAMFRLENHDCYVQDMLTPPMAPSIPFDALVRDIQVP